MKKNENKQRVNEGTKRTEDAHKQEAKSKVKK